MDKKDKAVEILEDALEQARAFYCGKPHLTLVEVLINLGVVLHSAQNVDFEKCLQYFQEAKVLMDEILGPNHAHSLTSEIFKNMAGIYYDLGDLTKAQQYLGDVLDMNSIICGENSVNDTMATVCSNLGLAAEKMGNLGQAKEYYSEAVRMRNKLISSTKNTDFDLFGNLYRLSLICETLGEEDEALKLLQEAMEIEKAVGTENWPIWDVMLKLNMQLEIGSFAKLLTRFQEGLQVAKTTAEEDCPPESLKYLKLLKQI
ncbi:tetratricopeptide repeat 28-like [Paramuricea clavata]|uniref:Tetratricopeptide repeat 28-like n=1 Tax=Paramuricea clavata TaxID=317549 RepID=A0A7D9D6U2_PARCT|nr:tetratricopeptide repeat 28-like [Paramuricea clavata]